MLKQHNPDLSGRALPLRSEKLSISSPNALALPSYIWFTPEVIILDALNVASKVLVLWKVFRCLLPIFAFRVAALTALIFLIISFKQQSVLVAANNYQPNPKEPTPIQITTKITARKKPVYSWPVPRNYITSYFSAYHQGIDVPSAYGSVVKPFSNGKVAFAGWDGGFGKLVTVAHEDGYISKYAHLSSISVKKGQIVGRETTIGTVGVTGIATGAHLHFEIHNESGALNPLNLLP